MLTLIHPRNHTKDYEGTRIRNYLKMAQTPLLVIPAKAGIQVFRGALDPGFRRGDGVSEF